jgi:hypothetical protein
MTIRFSEMRMKNLQYFYKNPIWWACLLFVSGGLLIIGWKLSFPILYPPVEQAFFDQVSLLFWIGLWVSIIALGGLVQTTQSKWVPWLASIAMVFIFTSPQFLYTSYGSDAGALATMVDYTKENPDFNQIRDVPVFSYAQWPTSIFYHRFLSDLIQIDAFTSARIGFGLVAICVAACLFLLWSKDNDSLVASRAAFWGVTVYFAGFYWFFNWQAVPYTFALALFLPSLILIESKDAKYRILLFLIFISGMEAHALFGIWMILIAIFIYIFTIFRKNGNKWITTTIIILLIVSQLSLIIYKNTLFFRRIALSFQGYYNALLETDASDKAIALMTSKSLNQTPPDLLGQALKTLAYLDVGILFGGLLIAFIFVLHNKRIKAREAGLLSAGTIYFTLGIFLVAIGTRSLQIIALAVTFFLVDTLVQKGRTSRYILIACMVGLVLFPSSLLRSHQINSNMVRPLDVAVSNYTTLIRPKLYKNSTILVEGVRLINLALNWQVISPKTIVPTNSCNGPYIIIDSAGLRANGQALIEKLHPGEFTNNEFTNRLLNLRTSRIYDAGEVTIVNGQTCRDIYDLFR